jgi:hypothetical protein
MDASLLLVRAAERPKQQGMWRGGDADRRRQQESDVVHGRHLSAYCASPPGQPLCLPHQLAHPDAVTRRKGGGGSRPGDGGGGTAGAVAIFGARTCLPKVLDAGADEDPRTRLAGRP